MPRNISGTNTNNSGNNNELPLLEPKQIESFDKNEIRVFIRGSTNKHLVKEVVYCDEYIINDREYTIDYLELYDEFVDDF